MNSGQGETQQHTVKKLERLAWWLDDSLPLPGTSRRIGLDGLFGLIPVVGDLFSSFLSGYILVNAAKLGVPASVMSRMIFYVVFESIVGMIPFVGDIFDFAFKANQRNVRLIQSYVNNPGRVKRQSRISLMLAYLTIVAALAMTVWLAFSLFSWLLSLTHGV